MCFDFVVLALALVALLRFQGRTRLWHLLFVDGIVYVFRGSNFLRHPSHETKFTNACLVAFGCYLVCSIMAWMGSSVPMVYTATEVATVVVSIAACRSFIRLFIEAHALSYVVVCCVLAIGH